jgi:hypothetical protein
MRATQTGHIVCYRQIMQHSLASRTNLFYVCSVREAVPPPHSLEPIGLAGEAWRRACGKGAVRKRQTVGGCP